MLTYQVRERVLFLNHRDERLSFPGDGECRFTLMPAEPFGGVQGPSRTAVKGNRAQLNWNAKRVESVTLEEPLEPISSVPSGRHHDAGTRQCLPLSTNPGRQATRAHRGRALRLPLVLGLQYVDAPVVTMVTGQVGGVGFVWQYARRTSAFDVTTKELQEQRFLQSWEQLRVLLPMENRRFFAALQYLHVACRLERAGVTPWEFMAEVLLNY